MIITIFAAVSLASSIWVYWDATNNKIGKVPRSTKVWFDINHSAGFWAILTQVIWINFLVYIIMRNKLLARAKEHPVEVSGRGVKIAALALVGGLCCAAIFIMDGWNETSNIPEDISAVWRADDDGAMVVIDGTSKNSKISINGVTTPVTLGEIDTENSTVNLKAALPTGQFAVWTLHQDWNKKHDSFKLVFTLQDGTQSDLSFVRKLTADDIQLLTAAKSNEQVSSQPGIGTKLDDTDTQTEAPPPTPSSEQPNQAPESAAEPSPLPVVAPVAEQPKNPTQITWSPSFDCTKVSIEPERLICSNKELSDADVKLSQEYKAALNLAQDKEGLKKEQNDWRRNERDICSDVACITKAYQQRNSQLSR